MGVTWGSRELFRNQKAGVYTSLPATLVSLGLYLTMCVYAPGLRTVGGMRCASGFVLLQFRAQERKYITSETIYYTEFLQEVKPEGAS